MFRVKKYKKQEGFWSNMRAEGAFPGVYVVHMHMKDNEIMTAVMG